MNVTCPTCQTVFRVDPAKVPERGVRARCSICAGIFFVERPGGPVPATGPSGPAGFAPPPTPAPEPARPATFAEPAPAAKTQPPAAPPVAPWSPVAPGAATPAPPAPPAVSRSRPLAPESAPSWAPPARPGPTPAARPVPPGPGPSAPSRPAASGPAPPAAAPPASRRVINPFLSQDPETRARRLARALISDLVVYNPAKRADGLRDGSLKILFEEEIKKCWEEYTEQVGRELAGSTPYFTEALNEILADGRPMFS